MTFMHLITIWLFASWLLAGVTPLTYSFTLLPVAREAVDILEAKLYDAEEEIVALKKAVEELESQQAVEELPQRVLNLDQAARAVLPSIACKTSHMCAPQGVVQWDQLL